MLCNGFRYLNVASITKVKRGLSSVANPMEDYQLLDCGDFKRLEKFGNVIVTRPCPTASWSRKSSSELWSSSDLVYSGNTNSFKVMFSLYYRYIR